jgi:p-cymene monooxygenase electron transfer component
MFGWLSKKQYTLTVGQGQPFTLDARETVLNGALRAGVGFPHSCKVGGCGACKCRLVSGKVRELTDKSYLLSREEIREGYILGCQSVPVENVTVEMPAAAAACRRVTGEITASRALTHDIREIFVRLDDSLSYLPGQYASVRPLAADIPARCYSFAHRCAAEGARDVSFFVRQVPNGRMSGWLLGSGVVGQRVELTGSMGDFFLRPGTQDLLCVAGGSGLAPLIALLEGALGTADARRNVHLLMGARSQRDLYYLEEIEALRRQWKGDFHFVPVLSEEPAGSDWRGLRGWVTDAVTQERCANAQGYLCGPPPMIDACMGRMTGFGMPAAAIHFDKFSDQSTVRAA